MRNFVPRFVCYVHLQSGLKYGTKFCVLSAFLECFLAKNIFLQLLDGFACQGLVVFE